MGVTRVAIFRPLLMLMAILAVVLLGLVSYSRLGVDLLPALDFPYVSVTTIYPGAGPEAIESQVTKLVEDAVTGISGVDFVQSTSSEGVSTVIIAFKEGTPSNQAASDVERRVSAIRGQLPTDAQAPVVVKFDATAEPILNMAFSGNAPANELYRIADETISPRLSALDGVASVQVIGGQAREIQVRVDQSRLQAYGLSIVQVTQALQGDNVEIPGGKLTQRGRDYGVRINGLATTPKQLENIVISSSPNGTVYLRDVAQVLDTYKKAATTSRVDGRDSVGILVTKQSDANTLQVADSVKRTIGQLQPSLPQGSRLDVITDQSTFTRNSLEDVQRNLVEAVLLTGLVLLVFLHTFRSTIIVLLAIPTSLIATFLVMFALGFTMNMMSMMALALTVGILVDDSIVVLENIFRHLELGETPFNAAILGRSEIGMAAIAITFVDVVVFTPIAFMSGIVGQYFRQFGLVVAAATLFSLAVSFTLTPLLASRWLKPHDPRSRNPLSAFGRVWDGWFDSLGRRYQGIVGWALRWRWIVVVIGVLAFVAGMALPATGVLSSEFMPATDQGELIVQTEMPAGTSLEVSDAAVRQVEAKLAEHPEVDHYFTQVGTGNQGLPAQARYGRIDVKLVPKDHRTKSQTEIAKDFRQLGAEVPGMIVRVQEPSMAGPGGASLQVQVTGQDNAVIADLAAQVQQIIATTRGAVSVQNDAVSGQPEMVMNVNRDRAADLGLSAGQVASAGRTFIAGSVVSQFRPSYGKNVDIRVMGQDNQVDSVDEIQQLPILTPGGQTVRFDQLADVQLRTGPSTINRKDRQRLVTVSAELEDRPLGDASQDVTRRIQREIQVPVGYKINLAGASEAQDESFSQMGQALGLSILLMYMLMVALFESLLYPFIIMLSLPLALVGAFGGLVVTGNTLNLMSLIGIIMLTGLVGKNAILLVDYTNNLRRRGIERNPALLEAGKTRLRPILMTTAAMLSAMLPLVLKLGEGAEWRAPMAAVVMGGLITSTMLTLIFIPAVYTIFDDFQNLLRGRRRRKPVVEPKVGAAAGAGQPAAVAGFSVGNEPQP